MRCPPIAFLALVTVAACGGSSKAPSEPPPPPNEPPTLVVPTGLAGAGGSYSLPLATTGTSMLTFTASDPDGDPLQWQVSVAGGSAAGVGAVYASPAAGTSLSIELQTVTAPAAATLNVLVEDPRGGAAAIDLLVARTGAPTITSVAPANAFAAAAQRVTITGSAFQLGGAVMTVPRFGGSAGTNVTVVDDGTLTCDTPTGVALGPTAVSVTHAYGTASLSAGAFTMLAYPPPLAAADQPLDGGAGSSLAVANEGPLLQAVWIEGGVLAQRRSTDGGASWTSPQTLSGGEAPSEPQVAVVGDRVTVVWIGDGSTLYARASADGGVTFAPSVVLNPSAGGATSVGPQLVASGMRRYCAWLQGSEAMNQRRVTVASSADDGATWTAATVVSDRGTNQRDHALGCDGAFAWVAYYDNPVAPPTSGPGVYTSRTTDGGLLWTGGVRRSNQTTAIGAIRVCNDGARVSLAWIESTVLRYLVSTDDATTWPTQSVELRGGDLGVLSEPALACAGERLFAIYVAGGNNVAVTRVGASGAAPQHVTVSTVTDPVGAPQLALSGNYLFAAWRSGDAGMGLARVLRSSSTNLGATFAAPVGTGDPTANQDLPRQLLDGARLWLGWQDARGVSPALFQNRAQS